MENWLEKLEEKILKSTAIIGIVGLGYVGLPLAIEFSKKFKVIGYDVAESKIKMLKKGVSYIDDIRNEDINLSNFKPTNNINDLKACDFIIIAVPTPLREDKTPDLSFIKSSAASIGKILQRGQFIILESTTYPGTTEEILVPILEEYSGLTVIKDFGVAYSPERVDPGNKKYTISNTPKVVGGLTSEFTEIAALLYGSIVTQVIKVRDCKTAEAVKMLENIFRHVNIALVNELALIFEKMGIDVWEVIDAAKTKPYGFMAFYPGPGVGGHCIPLDPFYLSYKAKQYGFIPRFIETAGQINDYMPIHTVNLLEEGLRKVNMKLWGSKIAVLGLAYKKNISDTRESPAIRIIEELVERGAKVRVHDPYSKTIKTKAGLFSSEDINEVIKWADAIVIVTDHDTFRETLPKLLAEDSGKVIIDTRNVVCEKIKGKVRICMKI